MKKVEILRTTRPTTNGHAAPASPVLGPRIAVRPRTATEEPLPVPQDAPRKTMSEAVRFVTDLGEITDSISELMTSSPNFNVVSAIGPQGAGKSTLLSMLAGNNSKQMYREYMFRPVSREANEQSKHQTTLIDIYVSNHTILLDCQPFHSFSIMEAIPKSRGAKLDDLTALSDTLRLTAFLLFVSHTVLVVSETHFDKTIIDTIRTAEEIRPYLPTFRPRLSMDRQTNLVFIKTKASSIDLSPVVIREREEAIRLSFRDSKWLRVSEKPNKVLIPIEEIRIRREQLHEGHENDRDERDERTLNDFDEMIVKLREELPKCKEDFTVEPAAMDEKKWVEMCREVIRDKTLHKSLRDFQRVFTDVLKRHPDPSSRPSSFNR